MRKLLQKNLDRKVLQKILGDYYYLFKNKSLKSLGVYHSEKLGYYIQAKGKNDSILESNIGQKGDETICFIIGCIGYWSYFTQKDSSNSDLYYRVKIEVSKNREILLQVIKVVLPSLYKKFMLVNERNRQKGKGEKKESEPILFLHELIYALYNQIDVKDKTIDMYKPQKERRVNIDHKDGNPANNNPRNLRWVTHKENAGNRHDSSVTKQLMKQRLIKRTNDPLFVQLSLLA